MKLLERESALQTLDELYNEIKNGTGRTAFVLGEAGIGKTTLVRAFKEKVKKDLTILTGTCDSLISPRPLGPLYDIASQLSTDFREFLKSENDRSELYSTFIEQLKNIRRPVLLIIEDLHWADEATLDLMKFLTRRIDQINCLLLITYRDDEVPSDHPLRSILGEIPTHVSRKIKLNRLSPNSVQELSRNTSFNPEAVFKLTDGNPFYVNEVLASYSDGIPENIKDSILSVFYKQNKETQKLWELISIMPGRLSLKMLQKVLLHFQIELDNPTNNGVLRYEGENLVFKHELYRQAIEDSLDPIKRVQLNQKVLEVLLPNKDEIDLAMIVHHAKNSDNRSLVAEFAPLAAQNAAQHGAHIQAADLYKMAINFTKAPGEIMADLYEKYAYECYLTNRTKKAIESQLEALKIWQELGDRIKTGSSMRILSRLNWFEGKKELAEEYGLKAIKELENGFPLNERAKAYSNYSQLKMLAGEKEQTLLYGKKAIDLAKKIDDEEIYCHALNNIGAVKFNYDRNGGKELYQSLEIALNNKFHEHVARAYTNIASISINHRLYDKGIDALTKGIDYCAERDLDSWHYYMLSWKARYHFETGEWKEAESICEKLLGNPNHPPIVRVTALAIMGSLLIRKGKLKDFSLLNEAKEIALSTKELQRIIPVTLVFLEYAWMNKNIEIAKELTEASLQALEKNFVQYHFSELAYWMDLNKMKYDHSKPFSQIFEADLKNNWKLAAQNWSELNCPFEQALALFRGDEKAVKETFVILDQLGAKGTIEFLKSELRAKGHKSIPRGPRESTKNNPAYLTQRQIDVLNLLREELSNAEIAERLFISAKTVDHHISAILSKLNVHSRSKAVEEAEKLGVIHMQ